MTTFSLVAGGRASIKRVTFSLISGVEVTCGIKVLLDGDDDAIETAARAAAKARGVEDPREGNPIYDQWVRRFTLLYACVSVPESADDPTPEDPPLFFDGGVEQIQRHLDRDRIAWLFAMQQQWQSLVSPRPRDMTRDEYLATVFAHATADVGDDLPFWRWHPALQESFLVTTACLCIGSPALRSLSSSASGGSATSSSSEASAGDNQAVFQAAIARGEARASAIGSGRVHAVELEEHRAARERPAAKRRARKSAKRR